MHLKVSVLGVIEFLVVELAVSGVAGVQLLVVPLDESYH